MRANPNARVTCKIMAWDPVSLRHQVEREFADCSTVDRMLNSQREIRLDSDEPKPARVIDIARARRRKRGSPEAA
jgi:hypothetical protein